MKILRVCLGLATAFALAAVVAPVATAAEPGVRYVAFGDSMTAAPYAGGGGPLGLPTFQQQPKTVPTPNPEICARSNYGWPSIMAAAWGLGDPQTGDWADYACQGATVDFDQFNNLRTQIDQAAFDGMLGPNTKLVTIQISANDIWHSGQGATYAQTMATCLTDIIRGCDFRTDPGYLDATAITAENLAFRMTNGARGDIIGALRAVAPKAQIRFINYEDPLPPAGVPFVCFSFLGIHSPWPQWRNAYAHLLTDNLGNAIEGAAAKLGVGFWSLKPLGIGHDLCSPQTHWTGLADIGQPYYPFHPTVEGHAAQGYFLNGIRLAEGIN
ncbi:SGNH/GDSL hydrolase family protein [Nocardia altamirensis]|uniref:SGNH/GDSL hydrolase family protein n=1 Tax=Nocardia altamirensis TaxID=472158 RepID=UPI00083FDFD7|nr:SGNH/GDSL hydrolase family protein [Nocardia altamirensis]